MLKSNGGWYYTSHRSVVDAGVLTGTPFGKRVRVRLKNLTTGEDLKFNVDGATVDTEALNMPVHITLRLLFLDDDEIPDR
jgi:hypothetical protein